MKIFNKSIILAAIVLLVLSCSQDNFEPLTLTKGKKIETTISVANLMSNYMTTADFFTADRISSTNQLVINGIVTSTDDEGNVYKYIAIQEETPNGRAIRVSIDASGISALYPLGQRVSVIMNNLCIGKYGDSPQVGTYYKRPKDDRLSPGAIPMPIARQQIIAYGEAEPSAVIADTMTIAEIQLAKRDTMHYKLVCIKDAWFTGKGDYDDIKKKYTDITLLKDKIFAPGTGGIGYPQSREIQDGSGKSIVVATSEFAAFAQKPLPSSNFKGNITVLVSWYNSDPKYTGNYQLTLQTLGDLGVGFNGYLTSINYTR